MGSRIRVIENEVDSNKAITSGRGNLSYTTINLTRIGIKHGDASNEKIRIKEFFDELEEKLDLVKDQILERFEFQSSKKKLSNFPFLLGQGIWIDSEKLKAQDNLRKVLKHGTLSIGFTGLAECLKALTGKNHAESEEAQKLGIKIVKFMSEKCDKYSKKYNLNFTLVATPSEKLAVRFAKLDRAIYGKIKGITDKECYTNSFHIPENAKISYESKIKLEAPYHSYTSGGHITCIKLKEKSPDKVMQIVKLMKESGIGYGAIETALD